MLNYNYNYSSDYSFGADSGTCAITINAGQLTGLLVDHCSLGCSAFLMELAVT